MGSDIIYKSKEWNRLELDIRVDLIPAIEKVRKGAQIEFWRECYDENREEQTSYLECCLKKLGIKYKVHGLSYYVSWEESWLDKLWGKATPEGNVIHELNHGQFLGYPQCCIDSFEKGCQEYLQGKGTAPMLKFWQDSKKAIEREDYNEAFLYVLHAPCSLSCQETIEMVEKIKKVLEQKDPEAARYKREETLKLINSYQIFL